MLDTLINQTIAIGLGVLFVGAAIHKLMDLDSFRAVVRDYQILPASMVPAAALMLPLLELLLA